MKSNSDNGSFCIDDHSNLRTIQIVSHEFPPSMGGAAQVALSTAEELSRKNWFVEVVTKRRGRVPLSDKTVVIRRLCTLKFTIPILYLFYILKFVRVRAFNDVVAIAVYGVLPFRRANINTIVFHGAEGNIYVRGKVDKFYQRLMLPFVRRAMFAADVIFVPSQFSYKELADAINARYSMTLGTSLVAKIKIFKPCVNERAFGQAIKGLLSRRRDSSSESIVVLTACRLEPLKGILEVKALLEKLIKDGMNIKWFIAGTGSLAAMLKASIAQSGLSNSITMLGVLNQIEVSSYMRSADIFLQVSQVAETYGLVYEEAIRCGACPIASNKGATTEIIKNGYNGLIVTCVEEIEEIFLKKIFATISHPGTLIHNPNPTLGDTFERLLKFSLHRN